MPDDGFSVIFCSITSVSQFFLVNIISTLILIYDFVLIAFFIAIQAWTQYFYTATWFWTLFYAIDTWLTIKGRDSHQMVYHSVAWSLPAVTTGVGLSILYIPDAT